MVHSPVLVKRVDSQKELRFDPSSLLIFGGNRAFAKMAELADALA
jgi:hypothetical protein